VVEADPLDAVVKRMKIRKREKEGKKVRFHGENNGNSTKGPNELQSDEDSDDHIENSDSEEGGDYDNVDSDEYGSELEYGDEEEEVEESKGAKSILKKSSKKEDEEDANKVVIMA
jgi:hypothetical protein